MALSSMLSSLAVQAAPSSRRHGRPVHWPQVRLRFPGYPQVERGHHLSLQQWWKSPMHAGAYTRLLSLGGLYCHSPINVDPRICRSNCILCLLPHFVMINNNNANL